MLFQMAAIIAAGKTRNRAATRPKGKLMPRIIKGSIILSIVVKYDIVFTLFTLLKIFLYSFSIHQTKHKI